MTRLAGLLLLLPACLLAQGPRVYFPWWESPITHKLNLTEEQRNEIRSIAKEYRDQMIDQQAAVEKAEADIQDLFNEDAGEEVAANEVIERLVTARANITRSLTQMSLKLRKVLTSEQWQKLQNARRSGLLDRRRQRDRRPEQRRPPKSQNPSPKQHLLPPKF